MGLLQSIGKGLSKAAKGLVKPVSTAISIATNPVGFATQQLGQMLGGRQAQPSRPMSMLSSLPVELGGTPGTSQSMASFNPTGFNLATGGMMSGFGPGGTAPNPGGIWSGIDQWFGGWLPGGVAPRNPFPNHWPGAGPGSGVISGQIPMTVQPVMVPTPRVPPGYVLVRMPNGSQIGVLKQVAYALGLRKRPSRGGGISRRDLTAARRVNKFIASNTTARKSKSAVTTRRKR